MKKSFVLLISFFCYCVSFAQFNLFSTANTSNKGEVAGKIAQSITTDPSYLIIGSDTLYLTSTYSPTVDLKSTKRMHAFYKVNSTNGRKELYKIEQEDMLVPNIIFCLPIASLIWATAANNIRSNYADYVADYGKVTTWGYGVDVAANVYPGVKLFAEMMSYSYKQEIAEEGATVHHSIDIGGTITMPEGLKYTTYTTSLRLGAKYTFMRDKMLQPWIGFTYGINIWKLKYITWDEKSIYGQDNGSTPRHSLMAGVNIKVPDLSVISIYFDVVSPVADYEITNLFGVGDYSQFDGMLYPSLRLNFAIGL